MLVVLIGIYRSVIYSSYWLDIDMCVSVARLVQYVPMQHVSAMLGQIPPFEYQKYQSAKSVGACGAN